MEEIKKTTTTAIYAKSLVPNIHAPDLYREHITHPLEITAIKDVRIIIILHLFTHRHFHVAPKPSTYAIHPFAPAHNTFSLPTLISENFAGEHFEGCSQKSARDKNLRTEGRICGIVETCWNDLLIPNA